MAADQSKLWKLSRERSLAALRALRTTLARCGVAERTFEDDDCLQELHIALWQAGERGVDFPPRSEDAWLVGVSRRVGIRLARRERSARRGGRHRTEQLGDREPIDLRNAREVDPARLLANADQAEQVRAALAELPASDRELLEAVHVREERRDEIARRRDISTRRVRYLAANARRKLARRLRGRDPCFTEPRDQRASTKIEIG